MTSTGTTLETIIGRIRALTTGWPDDLRDPSQPAFFARRLPDGRVAWYAIAHSPRQSRGLREQLLAFVGRSYTDFTGQPATWDKPDPIESLFATVFPIGYRLNSTSADAPRVDELMVRLRQLLGDRPKRSVWVSAPVGRLLRDFELSLRARDWDAGNKLLQQLRERGLVTTDQLAGMQLQLFAARERWSAVLSAPELSWLVTQRLPIAVGEAIAAALFHERLARFTTEDEAAAFFQEQIASEYGQLFRQSPAWRHPDALRIAQIASVATQRAAAKPQPADPYLAALAALRANDSEGAFRILINAKLAPDSIRLLVEATADLGTLDAARASVQTIEACADSDREKAFARRATRLLWDDLREIASAEATGNPTDWCSWLNQAGRLSASSAAKIAQLGVNQWPRPEAKAFAEALIVDGAVASAAIRENLAFLPNVLLPDGKVEPAYGSAYRQLLLLTVLDDELTIGMVDAILELAAAVLESNPIASATRNDYTEVVDCLLTAWKQLRRASLLDWGLAILDLVTLHAVHRHTDVTLLAQDIASEFARVPRLVTLGQRTLLRVICAEMEQAGVADLLGPASALEQKSQSDEESAARQKLGKRSIVLLTLNDRVAANFRLLMKQRFPDARVDVAQEYAGTKRLRDLSENADVFIVNTFDAKHAATGFVAQNRPKDAPTLYPKGKNAARQIDALDEWLR